MRWVGTPLSHNSWFVVSFQMLCYFQMCIFHLGQAGWVKNILAMPIETDVVFNVAIYQLAFWKEMLYIGIYDAIAMLIVSGMCQRVSE